MDNMAYNETPTTKGAIMSAAKNTALVILAAAFTYDSIVAIRNRKKFDNLRAKHIQLAEEFDRIQELNRFYAGKLNDAGIKPDMFDSIVIHDCLKK